MNTDIRAFNPADAGGSSAAGARRAPLTPRQAAAAAAAAAQQQQDDEIRPVVDRPEVGHVDDVEEIPRNDIPGQGGHPAAQVRSGEDEMVLAVYHGAKQSGAVVGLPFAKELLSNMWVRSLSEGIMYHLDNPIQNAGTTANNAIGGVIDVGVGAAVVGQMAQRGRPAQARVGDVGLLTLLVAASIASAETNTYAGSTPPTIRTVGPQFARAALEALVGMENNIATPTAREARNSALFAGVVAVPLNALLVAALGSETFHSSTSSLVKGQSLGGIAGSFAGYGVGIGIYEAVLFLSVVAYNTHTIGVDVPTNRTLPDGTPARDAEGNPETRRVRGSEAFKHLRVEFKGPPKDEHGNRTFKALFGKFLERLAGPTPGRMLGNAAFARSGAALSTGGGEAFQNETRGKVTVDLALAGIGGLVEALAALQDVPEGGFAQPSAGSAGERIEMQPPRRQAPAPVAPAPARPSGGRADAPRVGQPLPAPNPQQVLEARNALAEIADQGIDEWVGPLMQAMRDANGESQPAAPVVRPYDPNAPVASSSVQRPQVRRRSPPDDADVGA